MANGDDSSAPPMSESLGMPASMAGQPPVQPQPAPQPVQPAEPPTHHHALAGVLAAIAGPNVTHTLNQQTGQMTTIATPPSPGDAFRRILSGALIGMGAGAAAGAAGHPGAGILGGIGAGGTAVANRQQKLNQQDIENQQKQFDEQQKAQLNKATIAHLNAEGTATAWQAATYQAEANEKTQKMAFALGELMAENPNNKDYGTYASFDEFLQKHPEIAPDTAEQQGGGNLIKHTVYGKDGKVEGVHVYKYDPGWMNQTNDKPFTFAVPGGPGQEDRTFTVPAHSMKMSDIWKSATSLENTELKSAIPKSDRGRHVQDYLAAKGLPDTAANRLLGEKDYDQQTKIAPAEVRIEGLGATRGVSMLDTKNNNAPVEMTWNDINAANKNEPGRYIPSAAGEKALRQTALVEDIRGGTNQVRQDLQNEKMPEFSAAQRAQLAIAMGGSDPRTALSAAVRGGVIGNLTDEQQTYLNDLLSLTENAMAMRSMLGAGQGSEDLRNAIRATLPGPTTPSKKNALQKLDNLEKTLNRLQRGIPQVQLGGGGQAGAAGGAPPTGASDEVYKDGKLVGHVVNGKYVALGTQ